MPFFEVVAPIEHDGNAYNPGDTIELPVEIAKFHDANLKLTEKKQPVKSDKPTADTKLVFAEAKSNRPNGEKGYPVGEDG